jgi:adenylate cyclase
MQKRREMSIHPLIGNIVAQVIFWIVINSCFACFIFLFLQSLTSYIVVSFHLNFRLLLTLMFLLAGFHGLLLGISNYLIDRLVFVLNTLWQRVVIQMVVSILLFILSFVLIRYLLTNTFFSGIGNLPDLSPTYWNQFFGIISFQYVIGSVLSGAGVQVIRKYGHDIFLPVVLGIYKRPREEDRIFMFLDLKSSTTLAEQLGHIHYSLFIRQFIFDINHCLHRHHAAIYQYVGDEVVLTWKESETNAIMALDFYFACQSRIEQRAKYYIREFGIVPVFKAGVDSGRVTAVEIGDMKRDIAYHGDTLNTAARIQSSCNSTGQLLLMSRAFANQLGTNSGYQLLPLGELVLKGKARATEIFTICK